MEDAAQPGLGKTPFDLGIGSGRGFRPGMAAKSKSTSPARRQRRQPVAPTAIVDHGFVAARAMLLEVAAFLDRVERHGAKADFRCVALRSAARLLSDGKPERARRILEQLSDPTKAPLATAPGGAACGAWRKPRS